MSNAALVYFESRRVQTRTDEDDLRWYFGDGETVGAPPSNFDRMAAAIQRGQGPSGYSRLDQLRGLSWNTLKVSHRGGGLDRSAVEMDERVLRDAETAETVRRALATLSLETQEVLALAFGECRRELDGLRDLTLLAFLAPSARHAHLASGTSRSMQEYLVRLAHRAARRRGVPAQTERDVRLVQLIRREAEEMRAHALGLYRVALDAWRSRRREQKRRAALARAALGLGAEEEP